jgi:hypothetical protein
MRKTLLLSLLLCLLLPFYIFAQNQESFRKEAIKKLWKDTVGLDIEYKEYSIKSIINLVRIIESKPKFPDTTFAFVAFYRPKQHSYFGNRETQLIKKTSTGLQIHPTMYLPNTILLTDNQVDRLLNFLNNPLNWTCNEEAETTFTKDGGFVFFNKQGQIVAYLELGCGYSFFRFPILNKLANFGSLEIRNELGELLNEMFRK